MTRRLCLLALVVLSAPAEAPAQRPKAGPRLPEGTKAYRDLEYVRDGHARNKLDLYLPEKAAGPLPVVVWVHGGAWLGGSKDNPPVLFLLRDGYAVASINYRLSQHARFPAQLEDCKAAIRWLRAHAKKYNLDSDHVGVAGASAGGHLVALLGTTGGVKELEGKGGNEDRSSRVQCVVDLFGPADLATMGKQSGKDSRIDHDAADAPEARLIGGPVPQNKERAAKASPVTYAGKGAAPFLILHGDRDPVVPYAQSEELAAALKRAGVEVTLVKVQGAGHGGPQFASAENRKRVEEFLDRHLKKSSGR